jgi:protein tyrosine phosphatase
MASNIELQYEKLEEDQSWRDVFLELKFNDVMKSCSHAKHSLNLKYNRYKDILPYDHSRVKLKDARDTDYINANYVECKQAQRKYILAQGPLKNTCEHFWQMIWEEQTKGIVMLNRLFEKGISKCEMYYPNADEDNSELYMEFGRFRVNYLSELTFEDFAIRTLELENIEIYLDFKVRDWVRDLCG